MNTVLFSIISFLVALSVLVAVHEFGHFWVARKLGIKVLRFSIGFGKPILLRRFGKDNTEFAIASVPLGGYVKMLDEREGEVNPAEATRAFNRQSLATRFAVVLAGPMANLIFAVLIYWMMYVAGISGIKPIVGELTPGFAAEVSGFQTGDEIVEIAGRDTPTWNSTVITLLRQIVMDNKVMNVTLKTGDEQFRTVQLDLTGYEISIGRANLLKEIGFAPFSPQIPAVIGMLEPGGVAEKAGFQAGDKVVSSDGHSIKDWQDWVNFVRDHPAQQIKVKVERNGKIIELNLTPQKLEANGKSYGRIGAGVHISDELKATRRNVQQYSVVKALWVGTVRTWDISTLTLKMFWKMLIGKVSLENISGPITIAEYAGQSASIGWMSFFTFLALVSISLGVINLVPIPLLDGGHLMYYVIEFIKGSPVSENAEIIGQKIGIILLVGLMMLAFYNDFVRLLTN
ncbi:MAG: RIP metalloprotease RseP [Gammaproteobacteria bacterium]|nr:RIP metalloprotease RseP [Gammaproteobacteria bacterium]